MKASLDAPGRDGGAGGRSMPARLARSQPIPDHPGVSKSLVRRHARWLFRDQWQKRGLTVREWRLAEEDLLRGLEAETL